MRGPSMVVDALGDGKRAARDIDRRAVRRAAAPRRPGRGHAVREAQHRLFPARAAHRGPADPRPGAPGEPGHRGHPGLQPGAGPGRGGPLHVLRRLQRLRQLLHRVPRRQRDARYAGERALLHPHPLLQGLPGLRAGVPHRLPGAGAGARLRRARRRGADGDRVRSLRRRARRAGAVHPPAHRGRDRRVRRRPNQPTINSSERAGCYAHDHRACRRRVAAPAQAGHPDARGREVPGRHRRARGSARTDARRPRTRRCTRTST